MTNLYDVARHLHAAGMNVVPVHEDGSKAPDLPTWTKYQRRPVTRGEVREWFSTERTGIGIITGEVSDNTLMIEWEGRAVEEGLPAESAELAEASGLGDLWTRLLRTWIVATPSGGLHFMVRVNGTVPRSKKLARRPATAEELAADPGDPVRVLAETRGEGAFVVTAPSHGTVHPTGTGWETLQGGPDTRAEFTEDELEALFTVFRAADQLPEPEPATPIGIKGDEARPGDDYNAKATWDELLIPQGWTKLRRDSRNITYWRRPGKATGVSASTGKNEADNLFVWSTSTVFPSENPTSKFGAYTLLHHGGHFANAARELRAQGYGDPPKKAHLRLLPGSAPSTAVAGSMALHPSNQPAPADPPTLSDDGNAQLFAARYGDRLRYVSNIGWYIWREGAWERDEADLAMEWMKDTIRNIEIIDNNTAKHQSRSLSASALEAALRLARSLEPLRIPAGWLDAHPLRVNCAGGTSVDLTTGDAYPADPSELHTMRTGCAPERMPTPMFDRFLKETFGGDDDVIGYVQRLAGYALTGDQAYHILPFFHGQGQNGKSVLLDLWQKVWGDYATTAPAKFLMAGGSGHETEIARLRGVRLVVCNEVGQKDRFDEVKIKMLTGGDRLTGRFMRQDFFTFDPSHHIVLAGNHQPQTGGGEAFWRRLRLVAFEHRVPDEKRIPNLAQKLFDAEGPGILQWAIDGAVAVHKAGTLADPPSVLAATHEYEEEEDHLGQFAQERLIVGGGDHVKVAVRDVLAAYFRWCDEEHERPISKQAFGREMRRRFSVESVVERTGPTTTVRFYHGLTVTESETGRGGYPYF